MEAYQYGLFGKVSKTEIDIMVFGCAVKILLSDHERVWNSNGQINWLRLGASELIRIGSKLKLTKARVQSLIEQSYALDRDIELSAQEVLLCTKRYKLRKLIGSKGKRLDTQCQQHATTHKAQGVRYELSSTLVFP